MYKNNRQLSIEDFVFPYGNLSPENRWVRLATMIPWDEIDDAYAENFTNNGAPAHPARMAFGALVIKQMLDCSDRALCEHIAENPYLQFFIGLKEFQDNECPFGASTVTSFRKRFSEEDVKRINERVVRSGDGADDGCDGDDGDGSGNAGTLIMDATVAPADITYPQDMKLLNAAREHAEVLIDGFHAQTGGVKPRTYRRRARADFLNWSKAKRRSAKTTRKAIGRQLGYLGRDLGHIERYLESGVDAGDADAALIDTLSKIHAQQLHMHKARTHSVPDRIVSIAQPWVRPVVRGKAHANTEFGAKVHATVEDGFAHIDAVGFDPFHEAARLEDCVERYRERNGHYPERVLADKAYRNRANLAWCKERGIEISGPKLGRPPKDAALTKEQKAREYADTCARNAVEGVFGTAKTAYGLSRVSARLEETAKTVICMSVLVFNLKKLLRSSSSLFSRWLETSMSSLFLRIGWANYRKSTGC